VGFLDLGTTLLIVVILGYIVWQGYRALRGAHTPRNALWFLGRYGPPANDPRPRPPNRDERRQERSFYRRRR
jgi:hypothetical protein